MNPPEENCSSLTVVSNKSPSPKKAAQSGKMNIDIKKKPPTSKTTKPKEEMTIEPDMVGFAAGRKGCNLERLKKIYGVKITLPPKEGSQLIIEGPIEMVSAARKDIEQNLLCKTSFIIENKYLGLVMGQEGESIHAMEDALNVRIWINKEVGEVVVTGTRCEEAKKAIEEILFRKTSFFIEKDNYHLVVGSNGETILALKKVHNVAIDIQKNGEVSITGKESEEAKKAIESMIESLKTDYPFQEKFSVPSSLVRFVCGKNGSNRKRIESAYNVHVYISEASAKDDTQMIIVKGSEVGNVSNAKQDILENTRTIMDLDESLVERIIGPGRDTVRRINEEYGVIIYFEQKNQDGKGRRKVYIGGEKSRTKAAKEDIISVITGRKNGQ